MPTYNNGFGTGVIFSLNGVSTTLASGSILSFDLAKDGDAKTILDGSNNTYYVGFSNRIKTANVEVLFTGSGSLLTLPEIGATATLTVPWSNDVSGNWGVTKSSVSGKSDDAVKLKFEWKQWVKTDGTTLP